MVTAISLRRAPSVGESPVVRGALVGGSAIFLGAFLLAPLAVIFSVALGHGIAAYFASFRDPDSLAAIAVPANLVFGVCAAWAIGKFEFFGKTLLIALIDLPFSVSPVVAGLVYVLLSVPRGFLVPGFA